MAENSGIEWTKHTFNPWIGCTKISPACDFCYAETWDAKASGARWGAKAARTITKSWSKPRKWDREAAAVGERYKVFTASLADVFDNHASILPEWRTRLWALIRETPNLDWLLLTKRPQNIARYLPDDWGDAGYANVWLGISTENRVEMLRRATILADIPAKVKFWSAEPLLGDIGAIPSGLMPDWIITGGESGDLYREADISWYRNLRDQALEADVPFLFKQWSGKDQEEIKAKGRALDGMIHNGFPAMAA